MGLHWAHGLESGRTQAGRPSHPGSVTNSRSHHLLALQAPPYRANGMQNTTTKRGEADPSDGCVIYVEYRLRIYCRSLYTFAMFPDTVKLEARAEVCPGLGCEFVSETVYWDRGRGVKGAHWSLKDDDGATLKGSCSVIPLWWGLRGRVLRVHARWSRCDGGREEF